MPASFVDDAMAERRGDLLFRVPVLGEDTFLYILIEHQSGPDPRMPFRIATYRQGAWTSLMRREPTRRTLPIITALVVHHGARGWTGPRSLHVMVEGLDGFPSLGASVPDFELIIDDLVHVDDEALLGRPMDAFPKLVLWALRDGRSIDKLLRSLPKWRHEFGRLIREDPTLGDAQVFLGYILKVSGDVSFEIVQQKFIEVIPEIEVPMASAAEQLIQQGMEKGIQKGIQKGIEQGVERGLKKGRQQANRTMLARQLQLRFGALGPELEARIAEGSSDELDVWIDRVITADTLDAVFAD